MKRYRRLTVPAPGSKDYVTYKRYIKVERNGFLACQAVGRGIGNRNVSRYAEYAYIQKASDYAAENKKRHKDEPFRHCLLPFNWYEV